MTCEFEQALFTSTTGTAHEGYHLVAASRGLSSALRDRLTSWGPTHDALASADGDASAISWFALPDQKSVSWRVLAITRCDSAEYSGRGGGSTTTHFVLAPETVWLAFHWDPFRAVDALAVRSEQFTIGKSDGADTPTITLLPTRMGLCRGDVAAASSRVLGICLVAQVVGALVGGEQVVIATNDNREYVARSMVNLLPLAARKKLSFTTGLRQTQQRPLQLHVLPEEALAKSTSASRARERTFAIPSPSTPAPESGWGRELYSLLKADQWSTAATMVGAAQ